MFILATDSVGRGFSAACTRSEMTRSRIADDTLVQIDSMATSQHRFAAARSVSLQVNLPFGDVSRFVSRSLTGNSASAQETAVPPKSTNETCTPRAPPISDEFVSVQKVVAAEVAQSPGMCEGIRTSDKTKT